MHEYWEVVLGRVLPQMIELAIVGIKARVHGHQLDALELQILVPMLKLVFPSRLSGIDGKEADSLVGVAFCVFGNLVVGNPQPGQCSLASEDHGPIALLCLGVIVLPEHIKLKTGTAAGGSLCLPHKILGEVVWRTKEMRVNIDQHSVTSHAAKSIFH